MDQISQLKQRIREKGDDMEDLDFDKVMMPQQKRQPGRKGPHSRIKLGGGGTLDKVREDVRERNRKKNDFKMGNKKPGKKASMNGHGKKNKRPGKNARGHSGGGAKKARAGKRR